MGMTIAEKIIAAAAGVDSVKPGDIYTVQLDHLMSNDGTTHLTVDMYNNKLKNPHIADNRKLVFIVDHNVPSDSPKTAASQKKMRDFARENNIDFWEGKGVCHQIMIENYVRPGQLIFGADSHTCSYGALGAFGTGVGCTDFLYGIVCTHASNLTGNRNDIHAIGEIAKKHDILFIADAAQTAGVFPISMKKDQIDILCFSGHKGLMGPQGTGVICVRPGVKVEPLKVGGSGILTFQKEHPSDMPEALEAGTLNSHGIAGLRAALGWIQETGIDRIRQREQDLMMRFYEQVKKISGVTVYGDFSQKDRSPVVTLNIRDMGSSELSMILDEDYGISTRSGGHCAPLMHRALGTEKTGAVRFSFSCFNTEEEADEAARAVKEIAGEE